MTTPEDAADHVVSHTPATPLAASKEVHHIISPATSATGSMNKLFSQILETSSQVVLAPIHVTANAIKNLDLDFVFSDSNATPKPAVPTESEAESEAERVARVAKVEAERVARVAKVEARAATTLQSLHRGRSARSAVKKQVRPSTEPHTPPSKLAHAASLKAAAIVRPVLQPCSRVHGLRRGPWR